MTGRGLATVAIVCAILLEHPSSLAADANGNFAVKGGGLVSCGTLLAETSSSRQYFQIGGWLEGYLTAKNEHLDDTFDLVAWENSDTILRYVTEFCTRYPNQPVVAAAKALNKALMSDKVAARSELVVVSGVRMRTTLYRETLRRMQRKLTDLTLYSGEINGDLNAESIDALKRFQGRSGIAVTGFPSQETLYRLFRKP